jgi:hypothetical protein
MKVVGRWISDILEWLLKRTGLRAGPRSAVGSASALRSLLFVLIGVLAGLLLWLLVRIWKRRQPTPEAVIQTVTSTPNVADENIGADQLPEDGWMKLARELLERGEFRLALRAFYLATLAHLAERNLITLAKFKSNREMNASWGAAAMAWRSCLTSSRIRSPSSNACGTACTTSPNRP